MEHVVFHPAADGTPAFRRVASLEEAVRLVEHLRNVEGINEVSCHALTEVPLAFKAYYRVEVPTSEALVAEVPVAVEPPPLPVEAPVALEPVALEVPEQPVAEAVAAPAVSLGFFSR